MTNITVLKDESLGGVEREYREVKRKADVGERILVVTAMASNGSYANGDVLTVKSTSSGGGVSIETNGRDMVSFVLLEEYVTLEPSDIIRIDGARYRMVDRKAAVGERVIVTGERATFEIGKVFVVEDVDWAYPAAGLRNGHNAIDGHYRVLEPVESAEQPEPLSAKPAPDQAAEIIAKLTMSVSTLASQVQSLAVQLRVVREDCVLIEEGVSADIRDLAKRLAALEVSAKTTAEEYTTSAQKVREVARSIAKSPQEIRDNIVKRAKEDVADLMTQNHPNACVSLGVWLVTKGGAIVTDRVDFVVDRVKRTVVALVIDIERKEVIGRGIAKCAPGDVFNSHIGRAIALRRALGLAVPAEYFEAPQPTEVRVGDVVDECGGWNRKGRVVNEVRPSGYAAADVGLTFVDGGWAFIRECKITDDSREIDSVEPRKEVA